MKKLCKWVDNDGRDVWYDNEGRLFVLINNKRVYEFQLEKGPVIWPEFLIGRLSNRRLVLTDISLITALREGNKEKQGLIDRLQDDIISLETKLRRLDKLISLMIRGR